MNGGAVGVEGGKGGVADLRAAQQLRQADRLGDGGAARLLQLGIVGGGGGNGAFFQALLFLLLLRLLGKELLPAFLID